MNVPASKLLFSIIAFSALMSFPYSSAEEQSINTEILPIDETIGLEKTTLDMNIPSNNKLPWGFVEGKINNAVTDYPVIIQIFKDGEAFHFAQTDVNDDGTYEYKFRALNIDGEKTLRIFDGDYIVKIFKVVYLNTDLNHA